MKKITKKQLKKLEKKETNKLFKEWAITIKERDGNKCIICKEKERLNAHHIIPRSNKEFRFDIDNGASLCPLHHTFSRKISAHKNPFIFLLWLQKNRKDQFLRLLNKVLNSNEPKDF